MAVRVKNKRRIRGLLAFSVLCIMLQRVSVELCRKQHAWSTNGIFIEMPVSASARLLDLASK